MSVYPEELYPGCPCYACDVATQQEGQLWFARMSLCPTCGNKRCPGAADHTNECSGSNEPGQPGSLYPAVSDEERAAAIAEIKKLLGRD